MSDYDDDEVIEEVNKRHRDEDEDEEEEDNDDGYELSQCKRARSSSSIVTESQLSQEEPAVSAISIRNIVQSWGLFRFLSARRLSPTTMKPMTHFGMRGPFEGAYHLTPADEEVLFDGIVRQLQDNKRVGIPTTPWNIGEVHKELGPVIINLNFKYSHQLQPQRRIYTAVFIKTLIAAYYSQFEYLLQLDDVRDRELCLVLGKTTAISPGKDGLHIQFPNIITTPLLQKVIRKNIVSHPGLRAMVVELRLSNSLDDVIGEDVIQKHGWMLYGSLQFENDVPMSNLYYRLDVNDGCCGVYNAATDIMNITRSDTVISEHELVRLVSIRRAKWADLIEMTLEGVNCTEIEVHRQRQLEVSRARGMYNFDPSVEPKICKSDFEYVVGLVALLHPRRLNSENSWKQIGWCLFNIDIRLLSTWQQLTEGNRNRDKTKCNEQWAYMCTVSSSLRDVKSGIGTLNMMAREDSPMEYKNFMINSIWYKIQLCCGKFISIETVEDKQGKKELKLKCGAFEDVCYYLADIVQHYFGDVMVCTSFEKKSWMFFHDHRWFQSDKGIDLHSFIEREMFDVFAYWERTFRNEAKQIDPNHDMMGHFRKNGYATACKEFGKALRNPNKKRTLVDMCAEKMFWVKRNKLMDNISQFEEQLDSNIMLIGMNNGVYDLKMHQFRCGRPEDFVSMTTRTNYYEYSWDNTYVLQILDFMEKVFPNRAMRTYACKLLASFLDGHLLEKFYIWTGVGSNGKSKLMELFTLAMGNYCGTLPVTLITGKRQISSGCTPELCRMKGKRLGTMHESNRNDSVDMGLIKNVTGGDNLYARGLFKEPIEYRPTFQMVLLCNKKPRRIDSTDLGAWRRISILKFSSRFVDNPTADGEFQKDDYLNDKLVLWKEAFFWCLTEWYKDLAVEGNPEPQEVLDDTRAYKDSNDVVRDYFEECVEQEDTIVEKMTFHRLYRGFGKYETEYHLEKSFMSKEDFLLVAKEKFKEHLVITDGRVHWEHMRFIVGCNFVL